MGVLILLCSAVLLMRSELRAHQPSVGHALGEGAAFPDTFAEYGRCAKAGWQGGLVRQNAFGAAFKMLFYMCFSSFPIMSCWQLYEQILFSISSPSPRFLLCESKADLVVYIMTLTGGGAKWLLKKNILEGPLVKGRGGAASNDVCYCTLGQQCSICHKDLLQEEG